MTKRAGHTTTIPELYDPGIGRNLAHRDRHGIVGFQKRTRTCCIRPEALRDRIAHTCIPAAFLLQNYCNSSTGSQTNPVAVAANQSFTYDNLDRLTSYSPSGTDQIYAYDASGNRTRLTIGSSTYNDAIDPASNRLSSINGPTPAKSNLYDAAGNLTNDGTVQYGYSDRGRMASSTTSSGAFTYLSNALGQRVVKNGPTTVLPTGTARYVYDESGHVLGEYDGTGLPIQETVYLGDTPVAVLMRP
jgi:YD repeat-containing protein